MKIHIYHHHIIEDSCEMDQLRKENELLKKQMDQWLAKLNQATEALKVISDQVDSTK